MVEAVCVPPSLVPEVWPLVSSMLARASEHDDLSDADAIHDKVVGGDYLLWAAWGGDQVLGAWVTQVGVANGRKRCTIVVCGGRELGKWRHMIGAVEDFARREGCASIRIIGRKGWQRVLDGFKPRAVVLEKEL